MAGGLKLITNGTDNHMMVANTIESYNLGGTEAEITLDKVESPATNKSSPTTPIRLSNPAEFVSALPPPPPAA